VHNFVIKNLRNSLYAPIQRLKINPGGHKFKYRREVEIVVTGGLVTQNTDLYRQGMEKIVPRYVSVLAGTMWKSGATAVQLNRDCWKKM